MSTLIGCPPAISRTGAAKSVGPGSAPPSIQARMHHVMAWSSCDSRLETFASETTESRRSYLSDDHYKDERCRSLLTTRERRVSMELERRKADRTLRGPGLDFGADGMIVNTSSHAAFY